MLHQKPAYLIVLASLLSLSQANDGKESEFEGRDWWKLLRDVTMDKYGQKSPEEVGRILKYLDSSAENQWLTEGYRRRIRDWVEADETNKWRCHKSFFDHMKHLMTFGSTHNSSKIFNFLLEAERKQFEICKDILFKDLIGAIKGLDSETQQKAKKFLNSFEPPLPVPEEYIGEADEKELESSFIKGSLRFMESQIGTLSSKGLFSKVNEMKVRRQYKSLVQDLCTKVNDKLDSKIDIYDSVQDVRLLLDIESEILDWLRIGRICRYALAKDSDLLSWRVFTASIGRENKFSARKSVLFGCFGLN